MGEFSASVRRNHWIQTWAKLGFAVGGLVYLIVGLLAVLVAYDNRGHIVGPEGAIQRIGAQPYGEVAVGRRFSGVVRLRSMVLCASDPGHG